MTGTPPDFKSLLAHAPAFPADIKPEGLTRSGTAVYRTQNGMNQGFEDILIEGASLPNNSTGVNKVTRATALAEAQAECFIRENNLDQKPDLQVRDFTAGLAGKLTMLNTQLLTGKGASQGVSNACNGIQNFLEKEAGMSKFEAANATSGLLGQARATIAQSNIKTLG